MTPGVRVEVHASRHSGRLRRAAARDPCYSARLFHLHHELHHDEHRAGYVAGANATLKKLGDARVEEDFAAIDQLRKKMAFHLSGHVLHSLLWKNLSPQGGGEPDEELAAVVVEFLRSFTGLERQITEAAMSVQGSDGSALGWEPLWDRARRRADP